MQRTPAGSGRTAFCSRGAAASAAVLSARATHKRARARKIRRTAFEGSETLPRLVTLPSYFWPRSDCLRGWPCGAVASDEDQAKIFEQGVRERARGSRTGEREWPVPGILETTNPKARSREACASGSGRTRVAPAFNPMIQKGLPLISPGI